MKTNDRKELNMIPDLTSYDVILVNTSAGKDSQAMLDYVVELADAADVRDRIVAVHADLGRVEWSGTADLAKRQADHYGVPFQKVSRPQGDLLQQIRDRGMFPDSARRYCTSDQKRGQVRKVMTALTTEVRDREGDRQVRILNCMGLRAQESPARAKKVAFRLDAAASNGKRQVDEWLPILDWTLTDVWVRIRKSGVEHHAAYDLGLPRLSCCFCVLASKSALVRSAQLNPELADEYVKVEADIGHSFRKDLSMADIVAEARQGEAVAAADWSA